MVSLTATFVTGIYEAKIRVILLHIYSITMQTHTNTICCVYVYVCMVPEWLKGRAQCQVSPLLVLHLLV